MLRRRLTAAIFTAIAASGLLVPAAIAAPDGLPDTKIAVSGLDNPVQLVVDRWGVPHIFARNKNDAFFAQGFNAARDRLFQIDTFRRRGLGQLSEVLGPDYVQQDRAARMFLYRGDMNKEWASYGMEAKIIATKFTQGINSYLDYLGKHPNLMPPEFRKLGYRPARWSPSDVVRIRSHGLTRNLTSEVTRSQVACAAGLQTDKLRQGLMPDKPLVKPAGFDPCDVPADVLNTFSLATQNVTYRNDTFHTSPAPAANATEGSNNWVVAPERTSTGRPILANDPHRAYTTPSLRYISHLSAPGMNVIGANEPSLPGVSIGHNDDIAFGLTIFPLDQEDLYYYRLNPKNPSEYRYQGRWEKMRTVREKVKVRGGQTKTVTMQFTRHGPVLKVDAKNHRAFALRTAWAQPGMAPYFGSVKYMMAYNYQSFVDDMRNWGAPTENQVYADTDGNIAWVPGGLAPKRNRPDYDGLLPVPGDGRYEWQGFYTGDDLPRLRNPGAGYIATNNQYNLPLGYPALERKLGFEWTNPYRHNRTKELLEAENLVSVLDSQRIQNDQLSIPARQLTALLKPLHSNDPNVSNALRLLRGWDHVEATYSAAAALYEVWVSQHLGQDFLAKVAPRAAPIIGMPDTRIMIDNLRHPEKLFGANAVAKRNALLTSSLRKAWQTTTKLLGDNPATWQWGNLQQSVFEHSMDPILTDAEKASYNVGRFPRGGSGETVNASAYNPATFEQTGGASFRMVLDVGNWDASTAVNTPGQSGNQNDPHYRDLAELWQRGGYFPLVFSKAAVMSYAERTITLVPRRASCQGKHSAVSPGTHRSGRCR